MSNSSEQPHFNKEPKVLEESPVNQPSKEEIVAGLIEAGWQEGETPADETQTGWYAAVDQIKSGSGTSYLYVADIWLGKLWAFSKRPGESLVPSGVVPTRLLIKGPYNNKEGAMFCFPKDRSTI